MPKEDRSDWVAVAPEFSGASTSPASKIRPAGTAYQFFQKDVTDETKAEIVSSGEKFDVGKFSRAIRDRWKELDDERREYYESLAREDQARFAQESHAADVVAIQRREKLRKEREEIHLDDDGGTRRKTRGQRMKQEKKKRRKDKKRERKREEKMYASDEDDQSDSGAEDGSSSESYDSEGSEESGSVKRRRPPPKSKAPLSRKQLEYRDAVTREKMEKEKYIEERQEELRKDRADQAQRRLTFLLKQSNIFSHFGKVKEDQAKYGLKSNATRTVDTNSRRDAIAADAGDEVDAADLEEADEREATFLTSQPSTLGFGKMRDYQLEGLNWMIRLQENGVNGILADEMGLGKTLQSISVLVYMIEYRNIDGPHLIVVPKSTLSNWMGELKRWAPSIKAIRFHGDKETREEIKRNRLEPGQRDDQRDWHVCVTTYEVCNIEKNVMSKFAWSYLIIDEAHRLKNEASAFSKTVRGFETRYRILLTGTPLQNSLHELWALLNFLVPDVFASAEQFDEWFNLDIDDDDKKNNLISQLHKILRPFMLRRLKADVEKSLPPKHETILYTGMSVMQKKLYRDILIRDIDAIQGKNAGSRTAILNIVMQLRKCAGHPYLFPGVEDRSLPPLGEHLVETCGKMVLLDKLLKRLIQRGHRVLLFTQMTRILDIMEDYLVMRRFPYCRIDGNTSYDDRENYIEAYNKPNSEKFLFLLSTRAGGLGINLQTADVVILYDSDWNPQADLQAQDRAHRIGQKKPVQVFRLVTEHTIEEKIVERAQQKLKLDAMVVQQGRLKDKDKLSRNELLEAVRFGADKIFKSKDSSITDDDIDLILDAGKRKTQELNEKLQAAEKGDLLDFKLDGGTNVQTFEGVDYSSSALAQAKAEAELLGIIDMGKRERRTVSNYNENLLYQQQIAALQGKVVKERKKKKEIKLPKHLRLPRMEEWQMFDRETLYKIQEEEEAAFRKLPEEVQKLATTKKREADTAHPEGSDTATKQEESVELPPLVGDELQAQKAKLLGEGFADWTRHEFSVFVKASAKHGRKSLAKIAVEVGKSEADVETYASAFWGGLGKSRFSEHEYDRVVKLIEKGEKKIDEIKGLERGTRLLVSCFENPWESLEFHHVNCKDKLFTAEEDRYLLCWTHKFGYGQWFAIKMAIRRCPLFRFDYFLRSLPAELLGRRCEQLMKAAEKEIEQLERLAREETGLSVDTENEDGSIKSIEIAVIRKQLAMTNKKKFETEKKHLEGKVSEVEDQIQDIQRKLKMLNESESYLGSSYHESTEENGVVEQHTQSENNSGEKNGNNDSEPDNTEGSQEIQKGANGPDGEFVEFPHYDGHTEPKGNKKAFTHFCNHTRKEVRASLDPAERKNKDTVHEILRERWLELSSDDKRTWRDWAAWDLKRYERDCLIYESMQNNGKGSELQETSKIENVPRKHRIVDDQSNGAIPKKRRR